MRRFSFILQEAMEHAKKHIDEWCPEIVPGIVSMQEGAQGTVVVYEAERDLWEEMRQRFFKEEREIYDGRADSEPREF